VSVINNKLWFILLGLSIAACSNTTAGHAGRVHCTDGRYEIVSRTTGNWYFNSNGVWVNFGTDEIIKPALTMSCQMSED
jgi:hypothetical protein